MYIVHDRSVFIVNIYYVDINAYQLEKIPCMAYSLEVQFSGFSYLQLVPPQNIVHCKPCGASRRILSEILL